MKYNIDCIRAVLLLLEKKLNFIITEQKDNFFTFENSEMWIQTICECLRGYDRMDVIYSIKKLYEAGYIKMYVEESEKEDFSFYRVTEITYLGHEFLENIRAGKNWKRVKNIGKAVGSFSLSILGEIAKSAVVGLVQAALVNQGSTQSP